MKKVITGLPDELFALEEISKEQQVIKIYTDKRRYGKTVTIIEGFDPKDVDLKDMARALRKKTASGGTVKDGRIELQGDQREKARKFLESQGYTVEIIE
ncbi:stress response translation initiation inhibitor YciH [Candidatus Aciduliprofundum boonei]|uniref:Protein translation factor SUI1 homolog n=1 Tax=Aciduliprofundum boonei (strain DSM 19572 / T469) TaxID=439481 RepID=B5IH81_ACIB4|nr:stress response translation initiation inhibitor YciH [Candidatus Aciduliprofundum boonei]ADD08022.1 translation initiation factor SUI1 [Aciduliprofundum boonei T469]EDY34311.1 Translation initiation factor SUI1 superfamily [Aciduliprofundum boonei T469]EDY34363.1 Translation initiation factor SUI1 superfamily [Aciduliprofundum boonei T469]HII55109.1 stress response translation initiation inhibitor YciH [Candidatus Aciduliprofundum boonei]